MILEFFVERFADLFYDRLVGERGVDPGVHVLFTGPCGLLTQLVVKAHVAKFTGFVAHYHDYDGFAALREEAARVSIDGSVRAVVVPQIHAVPPHEIKRLCSLPTAWVIASGRLTQTTPAVFQVEVVAPRMERVKAVIAEECQRAGIATGDVPTGDFDTVGELIAAWDGHVRPEVVLRTPADTAHSLIASGAPPSYACKLVFKHALEKADDKIRITELAAECDAEMARCRRPLVLAKILEHYIRQIAMYSSSE